MPDIKVTKVSVNRADPDGLCVNPDCRHGKNMKPDGKKKDGHGGKNGRCFCGCAEFAA